MMNRATRRTAEYKRDVDATVPEAPTMQWTCPICSARQPAGVAFCVHVLAEPEPQKRRKVGTSSLPL